jgi:hypothetical protein
MLPWPRCLWTPRGAWKPPVTGGRRAAQGPRSRAQRGVSLRLRSRCEYRSDGVWSEERSTLYRGMPSVGGQGGWQSAAQRRAVARQGERSGEELGVVPGVMARSRYSGREYA